MTTARKRGAALVTAAANGIGFAAGSDRVVSSGTLACLVNKVGVSSLDDSLAMVDFATTWPHGISSLNRVVLFRSIGRHCDGNAWNSNKPVKS